ncbi:hypothetical protein CSA37_00070 [Candidatus Fermentibacteria bacterium]|nr:MAG: hypothetical protein CSA37_00070 [Candidatus Fermentibacteria bacterium]
MLPLLFLTDTVIAPDPDFEDIFVNEWGVVIFTSEGTTVAGAPDENGNVYFGREPYGLLEVDAPVVWIHGAPFQNATFTVRANQGELTALYPEPDIVQGDDMKSAASWIISGEFYRPPLEEAEPPDTSGVPFAWAMPFWREVPSMDIYSSKDDEYLGNFLYYEAGILFWEPPDDLYDPKLLAGYYSPEGLLIATGEEPSVERINLVPLPDGTGSARGSVLNDDQVCQILCGWAGSSLKSSEIEALWNTWKPFFTTETVCDKQALDLSTGSTPEKWILFPLPCEEIEKISSITLETGEEFSGTVNYNRFFLGLVRL